MYENHKKRRLRRQWRIAIRSTLAVCAAAGTLGLASNDENYITKAHAEELPSQTAVIIQELQNGEGDTKAILKDCATSEYAKENKDNKKAVEDGNVTVTASFPAVVTTPSLQNMKVTVKPVEKQETVQNSPDSNSPAEATDETATASQVPTKDDDSTATTQTEAANEQSKDVPDAAEPTPSVETGNEDSEQKKSSNAAGSAANDGAGEDKAGNADTPTSETSSIENNVINLDDTTETDLTTSIAKNTASQSQTEQAKINKSAAATGNNEPDVILNLSKDHIYVNNGDKVDLTSFVTYINDLSGTLPVLTIDSNLDTNTDGEYSAIYTAVGVTGEKVSRTMTITVAEPEELKEQRRKDALKEMRRLSMLGTVRGDGDYTQVDVSPFDSRMNTIREKCSEAEGRAAGYGGVLQCVDVAEWYIVNAFHKPHVSGNGNQVADNLLAQGYDDIVKVSGIGPGVLFSQYTNGTELGALYGHVAYINDLSADGKIAYVTQGLGSTGGFQEYYPWDFSKENLSNFCFVTTRENAEDLGLQIID